MTSPRSSAIRSPITGLEIIYCFRTFRRTSIKALTERSSFGPRESVRLKWGKIQGYRLGLLKPSISRGAWPFPYSLSGINSIVHSTFIKRMISVFCRKFDCMGILLYSSYFPPTTARLVLSNHPLRYSYTVNVTA